MPPLEGSSATADDRVEDAVRSKTGSSTTQTPAVGEPMPDVPEPHRETVRQDCHVKTAYPLPRNLSPPGSINVKKTSVVETTFYLSETVNADESSFPVLLSSASSWFAKATP